MSATYTEEERLAFDRMSACIRMITEHFPEYLNMANFLYDESNASGEVLFRWRCCHNRVLSFRWDADTLRIQQTLQVGPIIRGMNSPVTWGDGASHLPFDYRGEATLSGSTAHAFWKKIVGGVGG